MKQLTIKTLACIALATSAVRGGVAVNETAVNDWQLHATPNNSRISLVWHAVDGATSYKVLRSTSPSHANDLVTSLDSTNLVDAPLLNGVTYYYSVAALSNDVQLAVSKPASATPFVAPGTPAMMFADSSLSNRPFSKDPSVVRFHDRYFLYYTKKDVAGFVEGIAQSFDLVNWTKVGEFKPGQEIDRKGLCAAGARVLNGKVHLFYQSYGNFPKDAICHAISTNGIDFERDASNPVFRPVGAWNNGRAIDAETVPDGDRLLLYFATRDATGKTQELGVASAPLNSGFHRSDWVQLCDEPILKPELPWETKCIEAPTVIRRGSMFTMFYAGGYNNDPQQIGVATSPDGVRWKRSSKQPFLINGTPDAWNFSESGHPGFFMDDDSQSYLFYQGNNDNGKTWFLSVLKLGWKEGAPFIKPGVAAISDKTVSAGKTLTVAVALIYPVPLIQTLSLKVSSSNQSLLPDSSMMLTGTGADRKLKLTPVSSQRGTTRITITATDTDGVNDSVSFKLDVSSPEAQRNSHH